MAAVKNILSKTHKEAVIKAVSDTAGGSVTYTLNSDLINSNQVVSGTPKVCIHTVSWTGAPNSTIVISRGGATIMSLQANNSGTLFFDGQTMSLENTMDTSDIVLTFVGQAECWLRLHKTAGYVSTIEPERFGPYDNPTAVGS